MSTILELCSVRIAGLQYYGYPSLKAPKELLDYACGLFNEPTNKHDRSAVEVFYKDTKLGYIPKPYNEIIFNLNKQEDRCYVYGKIVDVNVDLDSILLNLLIEV